MNFKIRKIRKGEKITEAMKETNGEAKLTKKILKIKIPILISFLIIIIIVLGIAKTISSINLNTFLKIAGDELLTDEEGHTNFLILGTGDKDHEGADLTDTIMVASLDEKDKLVNMLSIPRDLYIKDETVGNSKINEAYHYGKIYYDDEQKGLQYLKEKVEEITGLKIQYSVKINFQGFKDLIDALDGIDIRVEKDIYDPYYPKDGTVYYETFSIKKGQHHLDGETALKYVRSRKTSSDFDRAARQQQVIYAIKEKALQSETVMDREKIKKLLNVLKANIETNIKVKEILTLGAMAPDYSMDSITHRLMHDNPVECGGLLYPTKYNEQYILIPAGGYDRITRYADLIFNYPLTAQENVKIYVLNGTKGYGVAGETKQVLQRYCFDVEGFGNAASKDITQTTYYYTQKYDGNGNPVNSRPKSLDFLEKYIPGKESTTIKEEYKEYLKKADVVIELGSDYVESQNYMLDDFYYISSPTHSTNPKVNQNGTAETE